MFSASAARAPLLGLRQCMRAAARPAARGSADRAAPGALGRRAFSADPNASRRGPITWLSLGVTAVAGGGLYLYYANEKEQRLRQAVSQQKVVGKAALGGPFTLVDMHGTPVTDKDFLGKNLLMYFGFSRCPDICPSELVKMGDVMERLEKKGKGQLFQPLYISVDPVRDSIKQLKNYAADFHKSIMFLTGTPDQCGDAARAYRVYYSKADDVSEDEYLVDHSIVIYYVGADGEFKDFFTQAMTAQDIVDRIEGHLAA